MKRFKSSHQVSRNDFTDAEIIRACVDSGYKLRLAAITLTELGRGTVSRELLRFWLKSIQNSKCDTIMVKSMMTRSDSENRGAETAGVSQPRILIVDIETAPIFGAVWGLFNNFLSLEQVKDDWFILSYSAKWVGDPIVTYQDQRHIVPMEDDTLLLEALWKLLDEADFVVAHNGRRFDVKKINARFCLAGMPPPSPYKIVDTLETAKRNFAFTSNKLAYLTDKLCNTKKRSHGKFPGYTLWQQCLLRNLEAWDEMELYNRDDVLSLEELFLLLRPWDDKSPNYGNYTSEKGICPKCGGKHLELQAKPYRTNVAQYELYLCLDCKGWSRGRTLMNTLQQRRDLRSAV